jgi:diadenylate cyclase
VILVILFQPELRSALEKMGAVPLKGIKSIGDIKHMGVEAVIDEVTSAVSDLASTKTGALIVFERETKLGDMILTGTGIDATPTSAMIRNIFFNKAPMHDGALIIRNGRLHAAGCFLPLSSNPDIIKDLGTRHRAGIGMSENSDAVVIIVSEETGIVSTDVEGRLVRGYREETLKSFLMKELSSESGEAEKLTLAQRIKRFFSRKKKKSDEEKGE